MWISSSPGVEFFPCAVYRGVDSRGVTKVYLAGKQLDVTKYKKWNTNDGRIDGIAIDNPEDHVIGAIGLDKITLGAIYEGDEEDEEYFSDDDHVVPPPLAAATTTSVNKILDEDIPQAFPHFTFSFSKRKMLICDIQGCSEYLQEASPLRVD